MAGKPEALMRAGWRGLGRAAERVARWSALPAWPRVRQRVRHSTLDVLFPGTCVSCGAELFAETQSENDVPFCAECLDSLELFDGPTCGLCGAPLSDAGPLVVHKRGGCFHCAGRKLWFDATIAAGQYVGRLRQLLLRMKHAEGQALSLAIGRLVAERRGEQLEAEHADVVVPVPMHWRRRLARGTNSAAILAEVLAGRLRAPLAEGLLRRRRNTPPQFSLTPPQRWENVRRAFSVGSGYHLRKAHVLVVDDILTTGATCSEAARALRTAGAERVTVVVAARAVSQ